MNTRELMEEISKRDKVISNILMLMTKELIVNYMESGYVIDVELINRAIQQLDFDTEGFDQMVKHIIDQQISSCFNIDRGDISSVEKSNQIRVELVNLLSDSHYAKIKGTIKRGIDMKRAKLLKDLQ